MKSISSISRRLIRKAIKSVCKFRVSAVGFNKEGTPIIYAHNSPRFSHEGGSTHAEMAIMLQQPRVKTILICRVGSNGSLLPIDPCPICAAKARELGIKITTLLELL